MGAALLLPSSASAFSFGTFTGGDRIASLIMSGGGGGPLLQYTGGNLTIGGNITTINMTSGTIFGGISGVTFSATVALDGPTLQFIPGSFPTIITASFLNSVDFQFIDVAGGGTNLASGTVALDLSLDEQAIPVVIGTLNDIMTPTSGDASFLAAFGPFAFMNTLFVGITTSAGLVTDNCLIVTPNCGAPTGLLDWTASPTATITPIPEPSSLLLLGVAGLGLAALRRSAA